MSFVSSQPERFAELHAGPPFLIPNPWDVGSARVLESLGFPALATTSSGFAFTLGRPDGGATLDDVVAHVAAVTGAVDIPVSVDLENGLGPPDVGIRSVAEAGAAGASIEDWDAEHGLYELAEAVDRVTAAAEAKPQSFVLTGRAENHLRGNPDLNDTIARLNAYADAGADCLYAPGLRTIEEIRMVCESVSKPVNVLAVRTLTVAEIFGAGAQRISVGGALTWIAAQALVDAATAIRDRGDLSVLDASNPLR
jgi:2-methylisocitrate lyase-like PEP mutase family enzyme